MRVWVDPPSGWRYGFPKVWNSDEVDNVEDFLRENGYPVKDIPFACKWLRMWEAQENE